MPVARARVVLLAAGESLVGLEPVLRRLGARPERLRVLRPRPRAPSRWLAGTPDPTRVDAVVLTSRPALLHGLRPWTRAHGGRRDGPSFWAGGPETARLLRKGGFRPVRRGRGLGAESVLTGLPARERRVLYLRSDLAGPQLARALRRRGHRVTERVVYDASVDPGAVRRARTRLRGADLLVVTSPSGFRALRGGLAAGELGALASGTPVVVLGSRSAASARATGFRRVTIVPVTTPQRFARHLVRVLGDARS